MKLSKLFIVATTFFGLLFFPSAAFAKAKIQIAILLDSSNSMDGLIDQTRMQLWEIVNALTTVTKDGEAPELEVALYHYGNDRLPSEEGFLRQLNRFTPELDLVSEKLFGIDTLGGQEYAGWVVKSAMTELNWSADEADFRVIFIAGNESFDQGPIDWQTSINLALEQDTIVNTIYCGSSEAEERELWAAGARVGAGTSFNINQNRNISFIESPYDEEIALWNQRLNETYIPYGSEGLLGQERQQAEDVNSREQLATRSASKVSIYYRNISWDLVDALDEGIVNLEDFTPDDLPEIMQGMTLEQRREYVATQREERVRIQQIIRELTEKRAVYVARERQVNPTPEDTLHFVTIRALQEQLAEKGFQLN
ncbi:MAG: hypothetical protein SW833_09255 [Cyanobacteriota bacterium]|nr:hypothetical protein [Cyanobacteriota bacterium]